MKYKIIAIIAETPAGGISTFRYSATSQAFPVKIVNQVTALFF